MTSASKPKAVIFDMDGTLCDVTSIRHHVINQPRDFDAFHRNAATCPANLEVVADLWDARRHGLVVLILTGRMERWRDMTTSWCWSRNIPFEGLLMRPDNDFRKDTVVKAEMLERVRKVYEPVHAWDDNPTVVELWENEGIPVTVIPGWLPY